MNLFITGKPGSGKTTLIKELIPLLESPCGFYTEEIREEGRRVGFLLRTISGKEVIMAHIRFKTPYQVGKYRVEPSSIKIGVDEIKRGVEEGRWIIIDEIGKMELFLEDFKEATLSALERKRVLGTIHLKDDFFTKKIKCRDDVILFELNPNNKERVLNLLKQRLRRCLNLDLR